MAALLGLVTQVTGRYNLDIDSSGKLFTLPEGTGIKRRYAADEYEWYGQDSWHVKSNLTVTFGIRYELEGPLTERYNRSVRDFDSSIVLPIEAE